MTTHDLILGIQAAISAGLVTAYAILLGPTVRAAIRRTA
jgi:hypothetical protein